VPEPASPEHHGVDRELDTGTGDLLARVERGVGVVVLNRPARRNALTIELLDALGEVLATLEAAPDVGALLLTGTGPAFCAGGDVTALVPVEGAGVPGRDELIARQQARQRSTTGRLHGCAKPTVAALPGAVAGAGIGLALACDLRVGEPGTTFSAAFANVGLSGDYGAVWLLSRFVGGARARRLLFLGERPDAATALEWGLLDRVAGPDELAEVAFATAAALAAGPRPALAAMKRNLLDADRFALGDAMDREVPRHLACRLTDDHEEALRAFAGKRAPVFGRRWTSAGLTQRDGPAG
jgi:2-(1,2-epoxy-1,2-dihydrophenyl)acetyl-CoA isomerase